MNVTEVHEDLLRTDIATARAVVTVRKAMTSKELLALGEQTNKSKLKGSTASTLSARFQQQKARIAKAAEAEAAAEAASSSQLPDDQPKEAAGSVVLNLSQRRTQSRSMSPLPEGVVTAGSIGSLSAGQLGAAAYDQAGLQSAKSLQIKKRGRPSNKDKKPTASPCKLPGITKQSADGGIAGWPAQQQQLHQGASAVAEPPKKLRKKPGRPPKSVIAAANSTVVLPEQQLQAASRLSSAGDGHRVSLDDPYRGASWPAASGGLQGVAQQQQASAEVGTWSEADVEAVAAPGTGMRTRLSMRSVAYLEDLLEQTAQAAASTVRTTCSRDFQGAGRGSVRGTAAQLGAASSGRLSVGNLIISPPMSRAQSMYQTVAGASPPNGSPPAAAAQAFVVTAKHSPPAGAPAGAAADPIPAALAAVTSAPAPAGAAVVSVRGPSLLSCHQQQQVSSRAVGEVPQRIFKADALQLAATGAPSVAEGVQKGQGEAQFSRAAACAGGAVVCWQQALAVSATGHSSDNSLSSSGEEESDDEDADVSTAEATANVRTDATGAATTCATRRRASYSSDTCSSPSSGSPVYNPCMVGAFTATGGAAGMGVARGLLYGGLLQGFGGAPAALLQGPAALPAGAAGPGVYVPAGCPRKSDRQVGLETVQVIDAIFQQSRSLQAGQVTGSVARNTPVASSAAAATDQGSAAIEGVSTPAAVINTQAEGQDAAGDERCTVAALCRGLRFDGDITLKEVAMAFQLRDAYDWDEDLEAAGKEVCYADQYRLARCVHCC